MKKMKMPKFISNAPHGTDKYEGQSGVRVAEAIKNHIIGDEEKLSKIIGLDGSWGSGKSNIIKILKKEMADDYFVFEYDAWGHQEDLQRRSFLETLTTTLVKEPNLLERQTTVSIRAGDKRSVTWEKKLRYLLARKIETETTSYPKIGAGLAVSFLTAIFTPITVFIAHTTKSNSSNFFDWLLSIIIASFPVIVALLVWLIALLINPKYRNMNFLLALYQDKVVEGVEFEAISEDEPSVTEFKEWMNDLSAGLKKKLIIVYDNMDRLPSEKVKELWSSIHTFFSEHTYRNIWVIIPFDKNHLANAFSDDSNNGNLVCHFISKTFPVIYRVAPPIVTDWKKLFDGFFEEAFEDVEDNSKKIIQRIFGITNTNMTPREIIAFINEIVSLKRTWLDDIPLLYISIFALKKAMIIESPVESILSGNYLGDIEKIVPNNDILQRYISALTYEIDVNMAEQIPLKQYLRKSFAGEKNYDINRYSGNKHFLSILEDEVRDIDSTLAEEVILCMAKLDEDIKAKTAELWNVLVEMQSNHEVKSLVFMNSHKELMLNSDEKYRIKLTEYLCNGYRNVEEFSGSDFFSVMCEIHKFLKDNNIEIALEDFIVKKEVEPDIFIDYINAAKERYTEFGIICENIKLVNYLLALLSKGLPNMDFIGFLINDSMYDFTSVIQNIELLITENQLTAVNFAEVIKAYKLISKDKPLSKKVPFEQVQSLLTTIKNSSQPGYYDLVAMGLVLQKINTPYVEGLDKEVALVIENYLSYGELLILSESFSSELLRRTVKVMTEQSYGTKMNILKVLPRFKEIRNAINIEPETLLDEISEWKDSISTITVDNIEELIPNYGFYRHSTKTINELTEHINKIALTKLETISEEDLYSEKNTSTSYWLNCASILLEQNVMSGLPDNLLLFSKRVLTDIASGDQPIPTSDSFIEVIVDKANKKKMQPTVKTICDSFCNKSIAISPSLFVYFAKNFDFTNIMKSRSADITRNILNEVFLDDGCRELILSNSSGYIRIIKEAGDDAEDLKFKIKRLLKESPSEELIRFALSVGVEREEQSEKDDV